MKKIAVTEATVTINSRTFNVRYYIDSESGIYFYQLDFVNLKTGEEMCFRNDGTQWYCDNPLAGFKNEVSIEALDDTLSALRSAKESVVDSLIHEKLCLN